MFRKIIIILIIGLLIINAPISAFALNEERVGSSSELNTVKPMWTEIAEFTNGFNISSTGKATIESILYAFDVDEIQIDAKLQQYKNGSWITIKSWTSNSYDIYCTIGEIWYVMSGYSYRLVSTGMVYENSKLVEQTTYTSETYRY